MSGIRDKINFYNNNPIAPMKSPTAMPEAEGHLGQVSSQTNNVSERPTKNDSSKVKKHSLKHHKPHAGKKTDFEGIHSKRHHSKRTHSEENRVTTQDKQVEARKRSIADIRKDYEKLDERLGDLQEKLDVVLEKYRGGEDDDDKYDEVWTMRHDCEGLQNSVALTALKQKDGNKLEAGLGILQPQVDAMIQEVEARLKELENG